MLYDKIKEILLEKTRVYNLTYCNLNDLEITEIYK